MDDGEQKLVDASGDVLYAVRDDRPVADPEWRSARIVLTSDRLLLATSDGKRAVPHERSRLADGDADVAPEGVDPGDATPLRVGDTVLFVDAGSVADFPAEYRRAVLHDEVVLAKHPAVVGGVVQEDAGWSKARFRLDDDRIVLGLPEGRTASFAIDDVGTVETTTDPVRDAERQVVAVEHTDADDRAVETHFSGTDRHARALAGLLQDAIERRDDDVELTETESQVLVALYSDVSPFEMADFVGVDAGEVEEIYQHLLDVGAVDKVRERTEVTLNAKGRTLASEAMNEQ